MLMVDAANIPSLPEDLIRDIVLRLPTKSVGRFKCTSKQWRDLLSEQDFVKSHVKRRQTSCQENILSIFCSSCYTIINKRGEFVLTRMRLSLGDIKDPLDLSMVDSVHGLVLLHDGKERMFLVNPITWEHLRIPNPPHLERNHAFVRGFGYDNVTDDYKIIVVSYLPWGKICVFHVYSVKTRLWRTIERSVNCEVMYANEVMPVRFVDNCIFWLARINNQTRIQAFDLAREEIKDISAPHDCHNRKSVYKLLVFKGSICVVSVTSWGAAVAWALKQSKSQYIWTKLFNLRTNSFLPLYILGDDEIVFWRNKYMLDVYNFKEGTYRYVEDPSGGCPFIESLVSPNSIK